MSSSQPARGRPRSREADVAIHAATLALLTERGFDGASTDAIAARAGVSKATIYRRWPTKDDLVLAAVDSLAEDLDVPDTGDLQGDLLELVEGLAAVFADERLTRLIATVVDQMARKPSFAVAMREGFLAARRQAARAVLDRARLRGQLVASDDDLDLAVDVLGAVFYYRVLITGERVDDGVGTQIVAVVLAWLAAGASPAG